MAAQRQKTRRKRVRKARDTENARQLRMFDDIQLALPLASAESRRPPKQRLTSLKAGV